MSTTKYDHLQEQEKHAALAREEAAIKAEALHYHDKHRMTPAKVAKLTARHVVLALLAAFWLIPILWLVVTSFGVDKGPNLSTFFPKAYTLDHYKALLSPDSVNQFPQWMLNTFIVACFTCVISTLFVLMVAYAMSCMRFKARKPLMNIAIILGASGALRADAGRRLPVCVHAAWNAEGDASGRAGDSHGDGHGGRAAAG